MFVHLQVHMQMENHYSSAYKGALYKEVHIYGSPDAETCTQCDDESLKNCYCAVEKCHKCVPPCTLRPYGLMNSDFPSACAPANGQTYSQVSNPYQKPGYVKRRQLAASSYSVASSAPMTSSSPE